MKFDTESIISALSWMLIHSLWQGLLIAAASVLVIIMVRKASARLRYNVLCSLLCLFIFSTAFTFFRQMQVMTNDTGLTQTTGQTEHSNNILLRHAFSATSIEVIINFIDRNVFWIAMVWFVLFCLKSIGVIRQFGELYKLKNYRTTAVPQEWANKFIVLKQKLGINKGVAFLESQLATVPCAAGFIKPIILVPVGLLSNLPPNQVEAILLHELAHIKRSDFVMNVVQTFTETLFFFNPALLWMNTLIREERENCCDDIALSVSQDRSSLVRALLSISQDASANNALSAAFSGRKNSVLKRAKRILGVKSAMINQLERSILSISILFFVLLIMAYTTDQKKEVEIPSAQVEDLPRDFNVYDRELQNDMISQGIIKDTAGMSYKLSRQDFIVNGQLQSNEVHQKFKAKYMRYKNMSATFYNWKFED